MLAGNFNIHFHVWAGDDLVKIVDFTRLEWAFDWKPRVVWKAHRYRKETTILLVREPKNQETSG